MGEPGPAAASPENAVAANLFEDLPPRYDRLTEVLSLGQNGRWRGELVRHLARFKPRRILDVATGTAGVAIALANATDADIVGIDISEPMLDRGRRRVYDAGRARSGPAPGRGDGEPGLLRAADRRVARRLAPIHAPPDALGRIRTRRTRVVEGRAVSWSEHRRLLPPLAALPPVRGVARSGPGRRRRTHLEPRRRLRDVGPEAPCLMLRPLRPRTTRLAREVGAATSGRCCTRRTRHGTSPTSCLGPAWRRDSTSHGWSPRCSLFFLPSAFPRTRSMSCADGRCRPNCRELFC